MLRAHVRDHKLKQYLYIYCKDGEELREKLNEGWKYLTLIEVKRLEDLEDEE